MNTKSQNFSMAEIALLLDGFAELKQWMESVEQFALEQVQAGVTIPGYVLGTTRSQRIWADPKKVMSTLKKNKHPLDEYCPRELLSVAQLEKKLGKTAFSMLMSGFIAQKEGNPKIIKEKSSTPDI